MNNPGFLTLGDFSIGAAGTQTGDWVTGLDGMQALTLFARLAYGSGGSSVRVFFQTSIDQGVTPIDVACFVFTIGDVRFVNLSGFNAITVPQVVTDGALADNTVVNGPLGDHLRAKVVSLGLYAGSTLLSLRGSAR